MSDGIDATKAAIAAYGTSGGQPICSHVRQFHQHYGLMPCAHDGCLNGVGGAYWTPYGPQESHDVVFVRGSADFDGKAGYSQWMLLPMTSDAEMAP